jgi:ABC transporter, ATP-binding protein
MKTISEYIFSSDKCPKNITHLTLSFWVLWRRIEMIKYLRKEMLGIILNIAGLFTVSGLQVYAALRMTKVAEYIIQQNVSVFMNEVFIILGLWIISLIISYYQTVYQEIVIQNICNYMRSDMSYASWNIKANYIDNQEQQEIESFLQNDVNMIENKVLRSIFGMIRFMLRAILSLIALFYIHYLLFVVGLILSIILYFIPLLTKKMVSNAGNQVSEANKSYLNKINNMMKGIDVLKEFGGLNFYQDTFSQELLKIKNSRVLLAKETSKVTFIIFLLNVISQLAVIFVTGLLILNKLILVGAILSTTDLAMKLFDSISAINQYMTIIHSSVQLLDKIDKLEASNDKTVEKPVLLSWNSVSISELEFGYTTDRVLFSNVNLQLDKGKWYVLSGASGTGKSTLFKLLLQQLEPQKGVILIDGINMTEYNTDKLFSYLRQQGYMFDTSIRENILLGKDESDNFKEIIKQLDIDLTKSITDLSGGEKQKIAIARLLVNPNSIILLDESFSSIDIDSSKMILDNLSKLENTMVIIITHRMQELEDIEYETIDILD